MRASGSAASRASPFFLVLLCALVLAACGIRLAPSYDTSLVNGLARANEETMTLFATVASGGTKATFPRREKTYDELIGKFDALRLEASARPNPGPPPGTALLLGSNTAAQQRVTDATTAPTSDVLASIIRIITTMRESDRKQGLPAITVQAFKQEFTISMQQALTYEKALDR